MIFFRSAYLAVVLSGGYGDVGNHNESSWTALVVVSQGPFWWYMMTMCLSPPIDGFRVRQATSNKKHSWSTVDIIFNKNNITKKEEEEEEKQGETTDPLNSNNNNHNNCNKRNNHFLWETLTQRSQRSPKHPKAQSRAMGALSWERGWPKKTQREVYPVTDVAFLLAYGFLWLEKR